MAGLLIGSPAHLHRLLAASLPPSLGSRLELYPFAPPFNIHLLAVLFLPAPSLHHFNRLILSLPIPRAPPLHPSFPFSFFLHTHTPLLSQAAAAVMQRCSPVCRCDHYATSPTPLEY